LVERLKGLGFREEDVVRCVRELAGDERMESHLDWLCLRVPDEHLPFR
jgi:hypothetical protein